VTEDELEHTIDRMWETRDDVSPSTRGVARAAVDETLDALDHGALRVAEKLGGAWHTHQWIKKAVLLSFRLNAMAPIAGGPGGATWYDKVSSKLADWSADEFTRADLRAVPAAIVRHSAFIGRRVVLMPSFINVGAYIGDAGRRPTVAVLRGDREDGRRTDALEDVDQ
jgi:2,3,4,5-tetrahydropyridine-2-carboxylate N-succinyltransferase